MEVPAKILKIIEDEAIKNARFSWYQGWEKASGYIKSELRGDCRYGTCRIYIKWERKKEPTQDQIESEVKKHIQGLFNNVEHHQTQNDFRHYMLETFFVDVNKLKYHVSLSLIDNLPWLISIIEKSEDFTLPHIQNFHNDLKNLECGLSDYEAISSILEKGRKRVGE